MNENLDLTKILDGCPKGTKLYSPLFGDVEFEGVDSRRGFVGVRVGFITKYIRVFDSNGGYLFDINSPSLECLLFPDRDQRDWSKFERFWDNQKVERFDLNTLQPFDRILARDYKDDIWTACLYSHKAKNLTDGWFVCDSAYRHYIIPYNDETKHLVGTSDDCPEYYKWWEE